MRKKFKTAFLIANGVLLLFIVGIGGYYVIKFASLAQQGCLMTREQVQSDSRCLYIYKTSIYEKGTRAAPHQGNACGSDVTSKLPESHILDKIGHLDPNYKGELCASVSPTTKPTSAPTTAPSATPKPTSAPQSTPTPEPTVVDPFPQTPVPTTPNQNNPAATRAPQPTSLPRTGATTIPTRTYTQTGGTYPTASTTRPSTLPRTGIAQIIPPITSGLLLLIGVIGILK